ncbi:hypothetical protein J7E97_30875 [Streptomyces sp. ISL-66]|uniref:hypothetical protein n=1 Tax=Streptomyces sp. ISL-66 TaxID=2819186 RepID=UPI001BE6D0DD|nr:hypothetical protein [Streptomyces sp. ISL-66]MBT2472145.1 hypothetical protein [Streptomyces sp. ISL-66]
MILNRARAAAYLAVMVLGAAAPPATAGESFITVIDNSHADSVLEVDRTANLQNGSGTAGSDHDGSAVDMLTSLLSTVHATDNGG